MGEAARAHTEADQRILDDLVVLDIYGDSALAMCDYTSKEPDLGQREEEPAAADNIASLQATT